MSTLQTTNLKHPDSASNNIQFDSGGNCDVAGAISLAPVAIPSAGTTSIFERNTDNAFYLQTSSGNRISFLDGSQNTLANFTPTGLTFNISNSSAAVIDSNGNVGIGLSSVNSSRKVEIQQPASYSAALRIRYDGTGNNGDIQWFTGLSQFTLGVIGGTDAIRLRRDSAEFVRVDNTGQICIGCETFDTSVAGVTVRKQSGNYGRMNMMKTASGARDALALYYSGTYVGGVIYTDTGVSFHSQSDYRAKENVVDISNGIERIKELFPKRFNFIINPDETLDGFVAHEAQAVVPEAVMGEKDGGRMQSIDQSKLIPVLTAALKEAIAKIETLETKVAALEAD